MDQGLISPNWYRVANLKPKLHSYINIHRHDYRGLIWYMLEDTTTGRNHRFNPAAYQFIGLLDGQRTVDDIYQQISEQLKEYAPGQEEIIQVLSQLHAADLLQTDTLINTEELFERQTRHKQSKLKQRFMNPVALKIPLWDPDDFLNRHFTKVRWLFTAWAGLAWLVIIAYSILQGIQHWPAINQHFSINALSPTNLLLLFLLYPPIKILHEMGHAFSAKLEGGEVHEMGVNFLLFMPIPYVNVSTATHFRSKYKRMLVSAAGILVESFLAAIGLLLFLASEPGLIQDIGFNMFVIGGISSLFFNGNPLLKYDAYYILADAIDIPNLYQRSTQYWRYFFQHHVFGLKQVSSPASAPGETGWFIGYSLASFTYRMAVLWFIFVLITEKNFVLGILITGWLVILQIVIPVLKMLHFVFISQSLKLKRGRALAISMLLLSLTVGLIGFMPIPSYTMAQGVVWHPDEALLKAEQEGFAGQLLVANKQHVNSGTAVIKINDDFLETQLEIAQAKTKELQSQYRAKRVSNSFEANIAREELNVARSELEHILQKNQSMTVTAFKSGKVVIPEADDLPGRFIRQGELIGYIVDEPSSTVRLAVPQDNIGQLRKNVENIQVRFANNIQLAYPATISRQAPEATSQLPSASLGTQGGGPFIVSAESPTEILTEQKVFIVDLAFDSEQKPVPLGTRAFVRFDHGGEPLAAQLYRRIRQVFIRQFNV